MVSDHTLEALKTSYTEFEKTRGLEPDIWLRIIHPDCRYRSVGNENVPVLEFATDKHKHEGFVEYFVKLVKDWEMVSWTPETFVREGDQVAMFGRCAWTFKATQKTADVRIAHLWTFKDGKAVDVIELFDSARAIAAATPD